MVITGFAEVPAALAAKERGPPANPLQFRPRPELDLPPVPEPDAATETAIETDIVKPSVAWQKRRDTAAAAHLAELDDRYYMDGQRRLEGLRSWTQGRVTMKRDEDH